MEFYLKHKVNQGIHIEGCVNEHTNGDKLSIDLIVREILGAKKVGELFGKGTKREVLMEVRGLSHTNQLYLFYGNRIPLLFSDIEIGIKTKSNYKNGSVTIVYRVPEKYIITEIE